MVYERRDSILPREVGGGGGVNGGHKMMGKEGCDSYMEEKGKRRENG